MYCYIYSFFSLFNNIFFFLSKQKIYNYDLYIIFFVTFFIAIRKGVKTKTLKIWIRQYLYFSIFFCFLFHQFFIQFLLVLYNIHKKINTILTFLVVSYIYATIIFQIYLNKIESDIFFCLEIQMLFNCLVNYIRIY